VTFIVMFLVMIASAVLQTILPPFAALGGAKFPLLLGVTVYCSLNRPAGFALTAAFLAGFLQDALGAVPLGYSSFCFCIAALAVGRLRATVLSESLVTQVFFGAASAASVSLLLGMLLTLAGVAKIGLRPALAHFLGSGLLGGMCAPAVCRLSGALDRLVGNVRTTEVEVDIGGLGRTTR